jgi:hypothetical protein
MMSDTGNEYYPEEMQAWIACTSNDRSDWEKVEKDAQQRRAAMGLPRYSAPFYGDVIEVERLHAKVLELETELRRGSNCCYC